jgi:HEAT repeats
MRQLSDAIRHPIARMFDPMPGVSWLAGRGGDDEIVQFLDHVVDRGELDSITGATAFLFYPSSEVKSAARRAIHRSFAQVSPERLLHLGDTIGQSWRWYISDAWDRLSPAGVGTLISEGATRSAVLGLLSFHHNGYVRHEALRLLSQVHDGSELSYLLIRQNDWVEPISTDARRAVQARLDEGYVPEFMANLSLVLRLLAFSRHNHSDLVRHVIGMLVQPKHDELLEKAIHSDGRAVRRGVVRLAFDVDGEYRPRVVKHALSSKDGVIRLWGSRHVRSCFSGEALEDILGSLRRDRFMPVRREALIIQADESLDSGRSIWHHALLDDNASIRELARFYLAKLQEADWPEVYRRAIIDHPQSVAALCGLGETGDRSDVTAIRGYLESPLPRLRKAAVRAFANLGRESVVADLVGYLQDDSPTVVREVSKPLQALPSALDGERLYGFVMADDRQHVRDSALRLMFATGKWRSLPWLIRCTAHRDSQTAEHAQELVEAWFTPPRCNRIFTRPSLAERQMIIVALDDSRQLIDRTFVEKLELWLKDS